MEQLTRYFPYGVTALAAAALLMIMAPRHESVKGMDVEGAGQLPVMDGGRVKPLEGYARTVLMQISSRQSWRDANDDSRPAVSWLFDVATSQGHDEAIKQAQERLA